MKSNPHSVLGVTGVTISIDYVIVSYDVTDQVWRQGGLILAKCFGDVFRNRNGVDVHKHKLKKKRGPPK